MISGRVERYSPADNKWDIVKAIHVPRFFGHLVNVQSYLYLLAGATIDEDGNVVCVDTIERLVPWEYLFRDIRPGPDVVILLHAQLS